MTALAPVRRIRVFARHIDAATPPHRDRAVDALRALAIAGVIGGHWLVTALVTGSNQHGTVLHDTSPLASMPWLAPVSWIFQTLAVFFLVGGYSAARGYRGDYFPWLRKRMIRLARPVAALVAVWIPVTIGMILAGALPAGNHVSAETKAHRGQTLGASCPRLITATSAERRSGLGGVRHDQLGVVEVGALADLLLVDGSPLENIRLVEDPDKNFLIIMKNGVVYKNTLRP